MNIAGVLVHAHPDKASAVRAALDAMAGVDVHMAAADGRLVVTVEDTSDVSAGDSILAMHRMEGVLSATLVYHNFDPALTGEKESDHAAVTA